VWRAGKALRPAQSVGVALKEACFESDRAPEAFQCHPVDRRTKPAPEQPTGAAPVNARMLQALLRDRSFAYGTASFPSHNAPSGHATHSCNTASRKCGSSRASVEARPSLEHVSGYLATPSIGAEKTCIQASVQQSHVSHARKTTERSVSIHPRGEHTEKTC
jgi:hypothetical protein